MTKLSRMQKYHGDKQVSSSEDPSLVEESTLQSDEEQVEMRSKSKLENYNTFLNRVIIVSSVLLIGIFIAMFFF